MNKGMLVPSLLLLIASTLHFCHDNPSPPATEAGDFGPSHYVRRTNSDTVIVFVHGVFGGSVGTWKNPQSGVYWPNLLLDDDTFKNADVYVYSYSSPYLGPSYTIDELIENMRLNLDNDEVFQKHKRVVFLCHSMGGLVVRGFLKRYQARAPSVPLIYFFSTPTAGSHIATLAKFLSKNPQLKGMLPANANEYVTSLQHDWRALPIHVNSRCAYEILDTYGFRIVDEQSASALCDGPVDPVDTNHMDIVKPRDKNDVPYVAFKQAFQAIPPPEAASAGNPDHGTAQPTPVVGTVQTARSVEVDCGQVRDDTAQIPPPIEMRPEQKILDAVASLQEASNLKEQQVEAKGLDREVAKIHYHLVGLDRPPDGSCPVKGYGVILVTFILSQPAGMLTAGFTPIDSDSLFVTLAAKSGTLAVAKMGKIPSVDVAHPVAARDGLVLRDQVSVKQVHAKFESERYAK